MSNLKSFSKNKVELAQCVKDLLEDLSPTSPSIMIISPEKSEAFCVISVTDVSWEDIEKVLELNYSKQPLNTSTETTPAI
jgi:hypothetical protein